MNDEKPLLHQLGAFDPSEASRLLPLLEQSHVPFELETDQTALTGRNEFSALQFGVNPEGAKILVFVPEPSFAEAQEILRRSADVPPS